MRCGSLSTFIGMCLYQTGGNGQCKDEYKPHPNWNIPPNLLYITEGHPASACYRTFGTPHRLFGQAHFST